MKQLKGPQIIIITLLLIITIVFLYNYVFTIYEVIAVSEPEFIFAGSDNIVKIYLVPVNAFGWKTPMRKTDGKFQIIEGEEFVQIVSVDEENGFIILRSVGLPGKVGLRIESQYALFPLYFEVRILNKSV
jgi:hypothetical protein